MRGEGPHVTQATGTGQALHLLEAMSRLTGRRRVGARIACAVVLAAGSVAAGYGAVSALGDAFT